MKKREKAIFVPENIANVTKPYYNNTMMAGFCAADTIFDYENSYSDSQYMVNQRLLNTIAIAAEEEHRKYFLIGSTIHNGKIFKAAKKIANAFAGATYTELPEVVNHNSGNLVKLVVLTMDYYYDDGYDEDYDDDDEY